MGSTLKGKIFSFWSKSFLLRVDNYSKRDAEMKMVEFSSESVPIHLNSPLTEPEVNGSVGLMTWARSFKTNDVVS